MSEEEGKRGGGQTRGANNSRGMIFQKGRVSENSIAPEN